MPLAARRTDLQRQYVGATASVADVQITSFNDEVGRGTGR
jgi:hypothetical protein